MCVRNVTGGEATNPMWLSKVDDDGFKSALNASLDSAGPASADASCAFPVDANLLGLSQPSMGFDMTVTSHVNCKVYNSGSEPFLLATIDAPYTATMSDAFMGVERLKKANEGSIRTGIRMFFGKLKDTQPKWKAPGAWAPRRPRPLPARRNRRKVAGMSDRRHKLEAAEARGMAMFDAIERAGIVRPGVSERDVDAEIFALAARDFGVKVHWHKRVVRAGANTVCTISDNPPLRTIAPQDTVYLDLGPVFAEWEADIGRTYALGDDPDKKRLVEDLPRLFDLVKAHFASMPDITGAQLYAFAQKAAADAGWLFGGTIAGHIVGEFPHAQRIPGNRLHHRIAPGNTKRMRDPDGNGSERHWILEIHLVDEARAYGGFYERLM